MFVVGKKACFLQRINFVKFVLERFSIDCFTEEASKHSHSGFLWQKMGFRKKNTCSSKPLNVACFSRMCCKWNFCLRLQKAFKVWGFSEKSMCVFLQKVYEKIEIRYFFIFFFYKAPKRSKGNIAYEFSKRSKIEFSREIDAFPS